MSKLRLLIVDDDALTLRALERIARNYFVVHTSPDIETAFARIEGDPQLVYDVVLCDLHFRSLSGRDLYDRLQRAGSDLTTRFVLLTGIPPVAGDPFAAVLEGVRMAPSASNKQPWRIVRRGRDWHFYLQRTKGYGKGSAIFVMLRLADLQRVDLGIAMCHFELVAREHGLAGIWVARDPGLQLPGKDAEYVATWVATP